jgi:hypothetical protein
MSFHFIDFLFYLGILFEGCAKSRKVDAKFCLKPLQSFELLWHPNGVSKPIKIEI